MKKINFLLAFCCLAAALSLHFKKPEYVFSAEQVTRFSNSFAPSKKVDVDKGCCLWDNGEIMPTGTSYRTCKSGTKSCTEIYCNFRLGEFVCPDAAQ